jgi:hypothetical protein
LWAQEAVILSKQTLDLVTVVAELGDIESKAQFMHLLGQAHEALPRNGRR